MMNDKTWGLVYSPLASFRKTRKRWTEIQKYLEEKNVEVEVRTAVGLGAVERETLDLLAKGCRTLVVVGGDMALNDMLNGWMRSDVKDKENVRIGIIPNGYVNDFAHYWGFDEKNYKQTIDWLIEGRIRKVDVGCCSYNDVEGTPRKRYFLNCVNVGLAASIQSLRYKTRRFWGMRSVSLVTSAFLLLFKRMEYVMHLRINSSDIQQKVMTMCVGNAHGYGQTPSGVPYNGLLDVSVVSHPEFRQLLEGLGLLFTGKFLNHKTVVPYRTRKVVVEDAASAEIGVDGKSLKKVTMPLEITVKQEVLNLIIPS